MNFIPEEISMIVSSNGAQNISQDGSYFEIGLQDGLKIPKDALNVNLSVEEATVWWVIPNITDVNNKLYITGPQGETVVSKADLGFPLSTDFSLTIVSPNVSTLVLENLAGGMPVAPFVVGDIFRPDEGDATDMLFTISSITTDNANYKQYTVTGLLDADVTLSTDSFSRVRPAGEISNFILTIPTGLYDLSGLNQAIIRELENVGAQTLDSNGDFLPLINLSPDDATQKVEIKYNYTNVSIDFSQPNTFREILGFNSAIYGPYNNIPFTLLADNTAKFNTINSLILHSDLTNKGIRFNNDYNQTIGQVLINVPPGSQIVSTPFNPPKVNVQELAGVIKTTIKFWLTDEQNRRVNTNGEPWSLRLVIKWLQPKR